jgi:hypothetical protein
MPEPNSGCWLWTGAYFGRKDRHPSAFYGKAIYKGKQVLAHRVAWMLYRGPIPDGLYVCHKCDNPACVNPDHLFLGTQLDNMRDASAKKRTAWHRHPEIIGRGESHYNSRLTADDVCEIRRLSAERMPQSAIARRFGIGQAQVWRIVHRIHWGHVA